MNYPTNTYELNDIEYQLTWIGTSEVEQYSPITQVYGVVFSAKKEILVCRKQGSKNWHLPGGHLEEGEDWPSALIRELEEEADLIVSNIQPIGVQQVTIPDDVNFIPEYQLRCIAVLDEFLPPTIDPDSGVQWERDFVLFLKIKDVIQWNVTGDAMLDDAIDTYINLDKA